MKTLITTVALATLIASPAFAQSSYKHQARMSSKAVGALAQVSPSNLARLSPNVVIEGGQIIGRDPDPNIRLQLRRDYGSWNY